MKFYAYLAPFTLLISSCDSGPDLARLCTDNPKLCDEFHEDTWCRQERKDVIVAKANLLETKKDKQKYSLLVSYEKYAACMEHAAKIEHIKLKYKQRNRVDNYLKARARIEQIAEETKDSTHPELLYFHWTRYSDKAALNKFLSLEGTKAVETPESQFNLATYYTKRDLDKSLDLLFHALELSNEDNTIDEEIFETITSIYNDRGDYKHAYIWLKILTLHHPDDTHVREDSLVQYQQAKKLDAERLDKVAQLTLDKILAGEFKSPKH